MIAHVLILCVTLLSIAGCSDARAEPRFDWFNFKYSNPGVPPAQETTIYVDGSGYLSAVVSSSRWGRFVMSDRNAQQWHGPVNGDVQDLECREKINELAKRLEKIEVIPE